MNTNLLKQDTVVLVEDDANKLRLHEKLISSDSTCISFKQNFVKSCKENLPKYLQKTNLKKFNEEGNLDQNLIYLATVSQ